jgi:nucleoside-diphosphate-sugar epimerase
MKILLTGSSGFLGSNLYDYLNKNNYDLETLNRSNGTYICDLSKNSIQIESKYDLVIHTAGLAHVDENSSKHLDINIIGTINLIKSFKVLPKKFILISTVAVYGLNYGENINENYIPNPKTNYGLSKLISENILTIWAKSNNINLTILRLPLIFGTPYVGNLKKMAIAIKIGYYFNINGGNAKRSIVLVEDLCQNIVNISNYNGIYNLTDNYNPTIKELSSFFAKIYNKKFILNIPYPISYLIAFISPFSLFNFSVYKKMTFNLTFDCSKAVNDFNWNPRSLFNL